MMRHILLLFFILPAFIANAQQTFENCYNGIDDDGDGLVDCADANCAFASECSSESANFNCSDGIDNDGDGKVDCTDDECDCASVEICNNGFDDDGDGLVDYYDGDCFATLRQQDSLALVALYHATDGDNWTKNDNWLTGSLDTWYGIDIGSYGILLVYLSSNNLVGYIPTEIGSLSARQLSLSYNKLLGSIPSEIGNMPRLDSLSLANNSLTGEIPDNLVDPERYYYEFDLSGNMLTGSIPQSMKEAFYSHSLNLIFNHLSDISEGPWQADGDVYIYHNYFTFEDILNINEREGSTSYGKQGEIGTDTTVLVGAGQTYIIELGIDEDILDNQYVWFKDQIAFDTTNVNAYELDNISADDAGTYTCEVTNPRVEGLRLYSHPTDIQVDENRQPQTITFDSIANRTYGDSSFVLRASTSANLPVRYQITEGEGTVITLKDSIVTIVGTGPAAIAALQDGNEEYLPATAVVRRFTINKLPQKITFAQLDSAWVGDTLTLVASSDASLPVSFNVSGPARLDNNRLTLTDTGQVTITAHQPGNDYYAAAPSVSQTIQVRQPLYSLSGQIWQQPDVPYVGKAYAVLYEADRYLGRNFRTQELPEDNTYHFDSLEAGKYTFMVSLYSAQYVPTYWGGHYLLSQANLIQLQQDTTLNLTLLPTPVSPTRAWSSIRGRLVGPAEADNGRSAGANNALPEVSVYLRDAQTGELLARTVTDETGAFAFTELPKGAYTLAIDYQGLPVQENTVVVGDYQEATVLATITDKITVTVEDKVVTTLNNEISPYSIIVFPNPVTDNFVIQANDLKWIGATVRLQNTLGNTVDETVIQHALTTLDVRDQKAGIYLLTVKRGSLIETQKIVKW